MTYLNSFCEVLKRKLFESANIANDKVYFYKVKDINDNFFEPMSEKVEQQYKSADGHEIESGKMNHIRSSSAMIYNLLGNSGVEIKENTLLPAGVYEKRFEQQISTLESSSRAANLDAWLCNDKAEIFIEAKCLEWIENGTDVRLKDKYFKSENYFYKRTADVFIKTGRLISCSQYDSCQMFKHTLAIYNDLLERVVTNKKIYLVNVVWELPEYEKLNSNFLKRYRLQEELEHLEFEYFRDNMKDIISLIAEETKCVFEIKYLTVKEFCDLINYHKYQKNYLNRYI